MKRILRHGDVVLLQTDNTEGKVVAHNGSFVLELGETTGHRHLLTVERPQDLVITRASNGRYFFELKSRGTITHEEHKTLILEPGIYIKGKEREKDWFSGAVRKVVD